MFDFIKLFGVLYLFSIMSGCQSTNIKPPKFEDCTLLSKAVFCVDHRLSTKRVDIIIEQILANRALTSVERDELINYFETNRRQIIKKKEFEISFAHLMFFRGYRMTNRSDSTELEKFMDGNLAELEKYRLKFGCQEFSRNCK